ncbi:hypothetical protein BEWA_022400 [Theileria equi strain WA]|uniref:MINDY deubiquitinase domain-containing protein n=1 Tax=Theileria equi strain WA TaxID=1537102 RepID=L0AUX0_THEEQ|nr:hypothetical protein BEWA_022400 [Theileria equi strain WA]AFZ79392.1 hypothetical protein BEWA_022400 [Theileria equi strain WA]|eukprot:XP_004829058.1 hypothetical protein BEWA_022400 [Theileria equi strain WA]
MESCTPDRYRIKWAEYKKEKVPYLLQSFDGECPFICLINILFLKKKLVLPVNTKYVSFSYLTQSISSVIPDEDPEWVSDILNSLRKGLIFNCRFDSTDAIIEDDPARLFKLFDIPVKHCWIADPEHYAVLTRFNYDEVQSLLAIHQSNDAVDHGTRREFDSQETAVILDFFDKYATQLTQLGVATLKTEVEPDSLIALYRNNHFLVATLHNGELYSLVSDSSFLYHGCIWESVETFSYFDDKFEPYTSEPKARPARKPTLMERIKQYFRDRRLKKAQANAQQSAR